MLWFTQQQTDWFRQMSEDQFKRSFGKCFFGMNPEESEIREVILEDIRYLIDMWNKVKNDVELNRLFDTPQCIRMYKASKQRWEHGTLDQLLKFYRSIHDDLWEITETINEIKVKQREEKYEKEKFQFDRYIESNDVRV